MTPKELVDSIVANLRAAGGSEHDVRLSAKDAATTPTELIEYLIRLPGARWRAYRNGTHGWLGVQVDGIHFSIHDIPAEQVELVRRRGAA